MEFKSWEYKSINFFCVGIFEKEELECHDTLTICPSHRNNNGVGWRCGRKDCDNGITPGGEGGHWHIWAI